MKIDNTIWNKAFGTPSQQSCAYKRRAAVALRHSEEEDASDKPWARGNFHMWQNLYSSALSSRYRILFGYLEERGARS